MKITVKAHPKSHFEKIIEHEGIYHTYFNVAPQKGEANKKITEMLANYFKIAKTNINLVVGRTSSEKVFEILNYPD